MITENALRRMTPAQRDQVMANVKRLEAKGQRPDDCKAVRAIVAKIDVEQAASWAALGRMVADAKMEVAAKAYAAQRAYRAKLDNSPF